MYELCKQLQDVVYSVNVFLDDEIISKGSAFAFLPTGQLLTAAHVVTGRFPIRQEDVQDPKAKVWAKARGRPEALYRPGFCGITIETDFFTAPVQLDIAVLEPVEPLPDEVPFLPTSIHPPKLGESLLLAGFSDEVELPFSFEKLFKPGTPGVDVFRAAMSKGYDADMLSLMIKSGMVGNIRSFGFDSSTTDQAVRGEIFYVDNGTHAGASGGPVVNKQGVAVGLISQRAITPLPYRNNPELAVPSGSTVCLSLQPLLALN